MLAEIITIGDEILIGQIVNTNSVWLAQELNALGFQIYRITSLADNHSDILAILEESSKRSDLIIITGGLGPTNDDITKQTLFEFFHSQPILNESVLRQVKHYLSQRNVAMNTLNEKQAIVGHNCQIIENEIGTAPGLWFEKDKKAFVALPGVPFEMKHMAEKFLFPSLKKQFTTPFIVHKNILCTDIGESTLAEKINNWENELPEYIKLAYLPSPGLVKLRLSATGKDAAGLTSQINSEITKLKKVISEYIFGYDSDTLEEIIGNLLRNKNQTLSVAESSTGGNIAHIITSISGSSDYFKGGIIAYSNQIKNQLLNIPLQIIDEHGAVSSEVAERMVKEVIKIYNTDYGIAVTGIAGPTGGTATKPVGTTWIAVASQGTCLVKQYLFGEHRGRNIDKTTITALNMLRKIILSEEIIK